jgi:hypothetical protein
MGYEIYFFKNFLDLKWLKYDQICIQTIEFVFKRSNLNSNRLIRSSQRITAHRLSWRAVVQALPPGHYCPAQLQHGRYRPVQMSATPTACASLHITSTRRYCLLALPPSERAVAPPTRTSLRLVTTKYMRDDDFYKSKGGHGSQFWRSLHKIKHLFKWGVIHRVRNGRHSFLG